MILSDLYLKKNYRFERKFFVSSLTTSHVQAIIKNHPSLFRETFPTRQINNIYLDTLDMSHYWDNVAGVSKRVKVRIRWYGELFGEITSPVLEFKIKNNSVGTKVSFSLAPFSFMILLSCKHLENILQSLKSLTI